MCSRPFWGFFASPESRSSGSTSRTSSSTPSTYRVVCGLARFLNDAWAGIPVAWVETVSFLGTAWTNFIGVLQKAWNRFSGFFKKVWARVKSVFTGKDAGEEIARINDEIAAEDNAINARRDAAVNERETERQRRRAAIEGERAGVEDELNRMQQAERAEREKRKQETLAAGEADIAAARKEWEEALAEAKRKREEADARLPGGRRRGLPGPVPGRKHVRRGVRLPVGGIGAGRRALWSHGLTSSNRA